MQPAQNIIENNAASIQHNSKASIILQAPEG